MSVLPHRESIREHNTISTLQSEVGNGALAHVDRRSIEQVQFGRLAEAVDGEREHEGTQLVIPG